MKPSRVKSCVTAIVPLFQVLSESAVMGIIIGLSVALPVLVLTTMNIIIGFIAWTVIVMVTVCVVGSIPLLGWKLGVRVKD